MPVVQIGMDTPQVTAADLADVADGLDRHDAVLGDAPDGGWWVLGLRRPGAATRAARRTDVHAQRPAPTPGPRSRLPASRSARPPRLTDVDTVADADAVAGRWPPHGRFAAAWRGRAR